jgi:hypothetical protein
VQIFPHLTRISFAKWEIFWRFWLSLAASPPCWDLSHG